MKGKKKNGFFVKLGDFIVDFRYLFLVIFLVLGTICAFNLNNVQINYDITSYLGSDTDTKKGLEIMENEFGSLNEYQILIKNVSYTDAESLKNELLNLENINNISFDSTSNYFKDDNALFVLELDEMTEAESDTLLEEVKEKINNYEYYIYRANVDETVAGMNIILLMAVVIIVLVLLLTTKSYFQIVLAFLVFGISILLNMGSNFIFKEISYITNSIAIILQLGLSLDYFIIFMNHYMKEKNDTKDLILAVKKTVTKSALEISSSSLTTIAGLLALVFMQLKIGADIGLVLAKGIVCSLLTVICFLPFLVILFNKIITKTEHQTKNLNVSKLANWIVKSRKIILPIFIILIIVSCVIVPYYHYVYNIYSVKAYNGNDNQIALDNIEEVFGNNNTLAVVVNNSEKDYAKELEYSNLLLENDNIANVVSLGNYNLSEGIFLGTSLNYQEFAALSQINEELALKLYGSYIKINNLNQNVLDYKITIIDLLNFLSSYSKELGLSSEIQELVNSYQTTLNSKIGLLESQNYSRFILTLKTPIEGNESYELIDEIKNTTSLYYDDVYLVGESVSAKDLNDSFTQDNVVINCVTVFFILLILLITFKSLPVAILLVLTIEGSILLNFGFATLFGSKIFFISYIIISAILMGATIDYAIVLTNRYLQLRQKEDIQEALTGAIKITLPTIVTSGFILTIAGFLIGFIASSGVVSSIGFFLGSGTLFSMMITVFVLPAILYVFDKVIVKNS